MKWLGRISMAILAYLSIHAGRYFFKNYEVIVMSKDDVEMMEEEIREMESMPNMDLRGTPTHVCVCGCEVFNLKVTFKDSEIATYMLDMECANCGSWATAPTPIDQIPGMDEK